MVFLIHTELRCTVNHTSKIKFPRAAEDIWTNPLKGLQEAIHCSFMRFCIYCFSLWCEFSLHYSLRVGNLSTWSWWGSFEISVSSADGVSHQHVQKPVRFVGGSLAKHQVSSPVKILLKRFVYICHRDNVLAKCDSIFSLSRVKECGTKRAHNFLFQCG